MVIFLITIIVFPIIAAIVLKSRYILAVIGLAVASTVTFLYEFLHFMLPERRCTHSIGYIKGNVTCSISDGAAPLLLITLIILLSVIMWFLAFKQRGELSGLAASNFAKPILTTVGWAIVLSIVLVVASLVFALSQM